MAGYVLEGRGKNDRKEGGGGSSAYDPERHVLYPSRFMLPLSKNSAVSGVMG